MPISTLFHLMPTLPPARSESDSCPELMQGNTRSLTICWSTQSGSTGDGQHHPWPWICLMAIIPNPHCSYRPQTGHCVVEWWPEDHHTGWANGLLQNFPWGSDHKEEDRYHDLITKTLKARYTSTLIPTEVGSRGLPNMLGFQRLGDILKLYTLLRILQNATGHNHSKPS